MKYKPIGKSGLISSNLTLGTMIFGENTARSTSKSDSVKLIDRYLSAGGNHIDTANVYAEGLSEQIIGEVLKERRNDVILSTKVRFGIHRMPNAEGLSRNGIISNVENSLNRLRTEYIDILYLHCYDPITPFGETVAALDLLLQTGKIRYVGISNFKAWQVLKINHLFQELGGNNIIAGQFQYSLVKRDIEYEFFSLFQDQGIGLLPWGPLGGGFLSGKYNKTKPNTGRIAYADPTVEEAWERRSNAKNWAVLDLIMSLSERYNKTPSQIALAWILSKEIVSSVVIGVRTLDQLKDNLGTNEVELSDNDIEHLNGLSALDELYPYRMIDVYGKRTL
jgi:aryl-alcohol dehydrogenase-like predicted oxidoreductase